MRNAWIAVLNNLFRPRLVCLRLRGFAGMFGIIPALKMRLDNGIGHLASMSPQKNERLLPIKG